MSGSVSFGGLVSGLDTNQLIEDLMTVDSQPLVKLEEKQEEYNNLRDTYTSMKSDLLTLQDLADDLSSEDAFNVFSASSSDEDALNVSTSSSATEGNYTIKILSLAQAESLSGNSYESTDTDLGITGEFVVNGESVQVSATDSLKDIRNSINALNAGVTASILKVNNTDNRLIITSDSKGEDGFSIANVGESNVLGELGFTDDTKTIRSIENGDVLSSGFTSSSSTIGSLLNITSDTGGTITIRNEQIDIDLSADSLSTIRDKINDLNIQGVTASVESYEEDDETLFRLVINGTQEFEDDANVLETLGILERGTSGTYAQMETRSLTYTSAPVDDDETGTTHIADETTNLTKLGAIAGETVTISGTDTDGATVSSTITIDSSTKISDVLTAIESAFNNDVTATIEDGAIVVTSNVAGSNSLSFNIDAGNESGGTLDFGTVATTTMGRDRLVVEGTDAKIKVNNIEISRDTNEINDVIEGLTLSIKDADEDTTINISVERDRDAIKTKLEEFVDAYNAYADFVEENSQYDDETGEAGVLLGDISATTIDSKISNVLRSVVNDNGLSYNQLVQIGVESTADGRLTVDSSTLNDALSADIDSVISLFTATREASDNDISFVYHTEDTKAGTYDVQITRAAEKAEAESDAIVGSIGVSGTLEITDNFGKTVAVDYTEDMTLEDIANSINEDADTEYSRFISSDTALKNTAGNAITQTTEIASIQGATVKEGDTITISATTHSGKTYERVIDLDDGGVTVQDVLDEIEEMNNYDVVASIDSEGKIIAEDRNGGTSSLMVTIETTVDGLDFGSFEITQEGRTEASFMAEVTDDNTLVIRHDEYGSSKTLTIYGGNSLGINDSIYSGVDVAGAINGVDAVGNGQSLTASSSDKNTKGIILLVNLTPEELAAEGSDQGTITLVSGISDQMYSALKSITDSTDGFIQAKLDSIDMSLDSLEDRIDNMEDRLEQKRQQYVTEYTQMEMKLSQLQTLSQSITNSLGSADLLSSLS